MKFTLEQFDFTALTKNSVLMVEINHPNKDNFDRVSKTIKSLFDSGKIAKGVLVLINTRDNPMDLKQIPEEVMNKAGWIKLKFQNGLPEHQLDVVPQTESESNHQN